MSSEDEDFDVEGGEVWSENLRKPRVEEFTETVGATFTLEKEKNELDFFSKFFPKSLVEKIVVETNKYVDMHPNETR